MNRKKKQISLKFIKSLLCLSIFFYLSSICHALTTVDINATVSGWVKPTSETNGEYGGTTNYIAGSTTTSDTGYRNYFVFNLSGIEGTIISATLLLENPVDGFYSEDNDYFNRSNFFTYYVTNLSSDGWTSSDFLPQNWITPHTAYSVWGIIGRAYPEASYGEVLVNETSNGTTVEILLNDLAISDLNISINNLDENYYALGGHLINDISLEAHIFSNTGHSCCSRVLSLVIDVDSDGDSLLDSIDNCPEVSNPGQKDADIDGAGDACDNCPDTCNSQQADADNDGIGDVCDDTPGCEGCGQSACEVSCDLDSDGVLNAEDNCLNNCNTQQLDADGDGIGDACDPDPNCGSLCGQGDPCELECHTMVID